MPPVFASRSQTWRNPSPGSASCSWTDSDSRERGPLSASVPLVTWSPSGCRDDVRVACGVAVSAWHWGQVATWRRVSSSEPPVDAWSSMSGSGCDIVSPQVVAQLCEAAADVALHGAEGKPGPVADLGVRQAREVGELHHGP